MSGNSRLRYLFTLLLSFFCLVGIVSADEVACEDMPCCAVETEVSCEAPASPGLLACGDSVESGCSCSFENQQPISGSSASLATFLRVEFVNRTLQTLILPEDQTRIVPKKQFGAIENEVFPEDFFLSLEAFPNPPPAAA